MPFGSRASSGHMQQVADAIVAILATNGVSAQMYLDDLIVVANNKADAAAQCDLVRKIIAELGLPEAPDKLQPPTQQLKWLSIHIDARLGTLTIPSDKLQDVIHLVGKYLPKRSISRSQLQSLLGKLLHVGKWVRPARLFMSRLLDELRGTHRFYINMNSSMRSNLMWFKEFAEEWNGVAFFTELTPVREILVDACLTGIGAATDGKAYTYNVAFPDDPIKNISEIEAVNAAIAVYTFIGAADTGTCVKVLCDNAAAVSVFQSGKGKNRAILQAARAIWMIQLLYQVHIFFEHIPGRLNDLADALSRASVSEANAVRAVELVTVNKFVWTTPCLQPLDMARPSMFCRSGLPPPGGTSSTPADSIQGTRDQRKSEIRNNSVAQVHLCPGQNPGAGMPIPHLYVPGGPGRKEVGSYNYKEPSGPHQDFHHDGRPPSYSRPPPCQVGYGGHPPHIDVQEDRTPTPT